MKEISEDTIKPKRNSKKRKTKKEKKTHKGMIRIHEEVIKNRTGMIFEDIMSINCLPSH